jgi:signal transduction histidine kinase
MNRAAEPAVAFLASAALFLLAAVIPIRGEEVLIVLLGGVYLSVVILAAKRLGPLYGVPLAIAAGLAFDSFYIPPVREFGAGNWQNWLVMAIYLSMGVLIGLLSGRSRQHARVSETARSELAEEQAALRRVATLVARGVPPPDLFEAVAREVGLVLGVEWTHMARYEPGGTSIGVAGWSPAGDQIPVGTRVSLDGESVGGLVLRTGRPARMRNYQHASGHAGALGQERGLRSSVGAPIVVDGRLWGMMMAASKDDRPLPVDAESRLENFTELVATAIANTEARTELAASRARIVAATDEERRRVVRDLHDGAQQRLVHTVITLKLAHRALQNEENELPALLTEALDHAEQATHELRELAHGILPAVLTQGGLRAGVDGLASRMPVPVENAVSVGRLPAAVEATAYFVVAEALTNVAKHARAGRASVAARIEDGSLQIRVRDDGVGGALPDDGSGLLGLADRLAVLDGQLRVESPVDSGTLVAADIPLPD